MPPRSAGPLLGIAAMGLGSWVAAASRDEPRPADPPIRVARAGRDLTGSRPAEIPPPNVFRSDRAAIDEALAAIGSCKARFRSVSDYTCVFYKRERMADGHLTSLHTLQMKARTKPGSIYFKFVKPTAGREAIYCEGKNRGRAWVHDVGFGKLLAGTLSLEPTGAMAMEDCRHPITEAGIGHLIDEVQTRWSAELAPGESQILRSPTAMVGDRRCLLIESVHPEKRPGFMFHKVKLYIDAALDLPIRFEAYDWPTGGGEPPLVEEYQYHDVRLNVGLGDRDFDPKNAAYSFGRF